MRIAFDTTMSARSLTGVGVYARELLPALLQRGLDVQCWQQPLRPSGQRWHRVLNGVRLAAWEGSGAARRCVADDIAVFHATATYGPLAVRRPVVLTLHDATSLTMPVETGLAERLFHRLFSVEAARRADVVLAPTTVAAEAIVECFRVPAERIRVVPLGVAGHFFEVTPGMVALTRQRYGLARPYLLYVGADTPRKNLATLVHVLERLRRPLPDLELILAGPPSPRDAQLDRLARDVGVAAQLRRLGHVKDRDLPALYAGAACVTYVSLCEGFGLPIIEAMAAGAPVVTSNCSSMPEVAGGAAMLIDPTSPDAIAAAVEQVIGHSDVAAALREAGRARSRQFEWRRTARLTEQAYRDVSGLSGAGASRATGQATPAS
jgi:glycosyltransferase involved in cell wall biosynthesis